MKTRILSKLANFTAECGSQGPKLTHVLQRVEVDHTVLDLFVVDEQDRLPIGRPTLTIALDVYSGMPFGVFVSFEPPSYLAVMGCLLHGILPKTNAKEAYGTRNPWPVHGLPEALVCDNGKEFVGRDLADACAQLGLTLDPNPPRAPWCKGALERFIRTHNTGLVHTLPGTTFSNIAAHGDCNPSRYPCISLPALSKLLHVWLLDVYAQRWHEGIQGVPAKRWAESLASGWEPALHHSAEEVRILLCRTAERTIQRTGIDFESLRYQDPELARLRSTLPASPKVRIKYDPGDLGAIHVFDPAGRWLRVPALDPEYAGGMSLWKHRALRSLVLSEKGEVDIYALAEAKRRLHEIAQDEFESTRTVRGRKRAARILGRGRETVSPMGVPGAEEVPDFPKSPIGLDLSMSSPVTAFPAEGWEGDYELPGAPATHAREEGYS